MRKHRNAGAEAAQSMIKATGGHAIGGATRHGVFLPNPNFCVQKKDEMLDLISSKTSKYLSLRLRKHCS